MQPFTRSRASFLAGSGVGEGVHVAQGVSGDQGINLGGGDRGVAEQFLNDAYVGAPGQQMRGEGVPQGVRRDRHGQSGSFGGGSDDQPGVLPTNPLPTQPEKQGRGRATASGQPRPGAHQIVGDRGAREAADRNDALLVALAGEPHRVEVFQAHVVDVEFDDLAHPRAGRVEQLEQGFVAQALHVVAVGRRE